MLKHFSKVLIFTLLACASSTVHAAVVSEDEARQCAAEFFSASRQERLASVDALELAHMAGNASNPLYYVFNARDGHGFIIISADDCTDPILGYSFENSFNGSSAPAAMKWMLSGLEKEIKAAPQLQKPTSVAERRNIVRRAGTSTSPIELKTALWRQEAPFNQAIPNRPLVGCVGTAMAIIMKHHEFPTRGTGSYNGVNFDVEYNWDAMLDGNYMGGYSEEQAEAVSTLFLHTATSIGTQFGMSGSSAYEVRVPAALTQYFGYDPGVSYKKRSEASSQAEFDRIVAEEIKSGRPVLYCGQDVTIGHAFVADGYDPATGMIYINWGWGGLANGWFRTTMLNPNASHSYSFNNLVTIVYNIKPGTGDNTMWSPIHITADSGQPGMGSDMVSLSAGQNFTVRVGNLKNVSYTDFNGKIAVSLFDEAGNFKALLSQARDFSLKSMYVLNSGYYDFRQCALPAGASVSAGDMVRIATSADNGVTWQAVPGELITVNEIPALRTEPDWFDIKFPSSVAGVSYEGESRVIRGWDYAFSVTPQNPAEDVVTVKANGYILNPVANSYNYRVANVKEDQIIDIIVQKASEVKEKRSIWVGEAGTLSTIISDIDAGIIKDLTLFGSIDARDFEFMRTKMDLTRLDISSVYIAANGTNQANALPKSAFQGKGRLKEVLLPNSLNRINNAAFRQCGITSIVIPAGVSTYEYNVFLGASALRDIWVGRTKAEFINWCVLSGTNKGAMTLHVPNETARNNYSNKEYWKEIGNIVVDPIPAQNDFAFAVMEDNSVKFECETPNGRLEKGTTVTFTAQYTADNDDRMAVYANSTLLTPDAQGVYSTTINGNTIVHFDLIKPTPVVTAASSPWQITDTGGTIGMFSDAVNVIPGVNFAVRINAFSVPSEYNSMFWAMALTDASGNIKEFISPVSTWGGAHGNNLKMTVNCCVKEASVREGNMLRLVTSHNKKTWYLVEGSNEDVVDALPALNNQTPVYNISIPDLPNANVSGAVTTAVRGRDINLKITPKASSHTIDVILNGDTILTGGKTFNYSFIAKQDMDFDVRIVPPVSYTEATIVLKEGEHLYLSGYEGIDNWGQINYATAEKFRNITKLKIVGKVDFYDFNLFRENYWVAANIRYLDLSEAQFVSDRGKPASEGLDNVFPSRALYNPQLPGCFVEEIVLPNTLTQFDSDAFKGCSRLKEVKLPENLRYWKTGKTISNGILKNLTRGGLLDDVFTGCSALETIYAPCAPGPDGNIGHWYYSQYHQLRTGFPDNKKVTVIVPDEYLEAYKTPRVGTGDFESDWSNGWHAAGFNILSVYPVYSLNFDASKCFVTDDEIKSNVSRAAVFLKDNIERESIERKLFIAAKSDIAEGRPDGIDAFNPGCKVKVYDNGTLLPEDAIAADGSITVTYYNPNKHADKSCNHEIEVVYFYDVNFNCSSDMFTVNIENNDEGNAWNWNTTIPTAPVLEDVTDGSVIRFSIGMGTQNNDITAKVKVGEQVLEADETGTYAIAIDNASVNVDIYAVPSNGASLTQEEFLSLNPAEASDVNSIALTGDIDAETLEAVVENLPALEELDLSDMNGDIPAGTFEGQTSLAVVALPESATSIEENTFSGCTSLTTVSIPESVSSIGAGAFNGCSSLESLTLTGVESIGEGAFSGCDNMTSLNLNPANSDTSRRNSRNARVAGFDKNAFSGLNPNCLIIVGEGVAVPATEANYITTRTGEIDDFDAEGNPIVRVGRIYESGSDITLKPGYPFASANPFSVLDGYEISYTGEFQASGKKGGWTSLVLPFNAQKIEDTNGKKLICDSDAENHNPDADYMVATIDEAKGELDLQPSIAANTPYIMRLCPERSACSIKFSATGVKVNSTNDEIKKEGNDYTLFASFGTTDAPASTSYVLDEDGARFVKNTEAEAVAEGSDENASSTISIAPFSVYAVSESGVSYFDIKVGDIQVGIEDIAAEGSDMTFAREGDTLVIFAANAIDTAIYSIDGRLIGRISLCAGRNAINGLQHGIYLVGNHKVVF